MARGTRSLTTLSPTRIGVRHGDAEVGKRGPDATMHIVRIACGEVFDIVAEDVAETGHERVEQALGGPLNPHVEKPELRRRERQAANYVSEGTAI